MDCVWDTSWISGGSRIICKCECCLIAGRGGCGGECGVFLRAGRQAAHTNYDTYATRPAIKPQWLNGDLSVGLRGIVEGLRHAGSRSYLDGCAPRAVDNRVCRYCGGIADDLEGYLLHSVG